jgi:hypothetical protein
MPDAAVGREVIRPASHHFGLTTANMEVMLDWYGKVLGLTLNHKTTTPAGAKKVKCAWLKNDKANHRIAIVSLTGLADNPDRRGRLRMRTQRGATS